MLNADFRPPTVALEALRKAAAQQDAATLLVALERQNGQVSHHEIEVLPPAHPRQAEALQVLDRWLKFLLYARGAWRVHLGVDGPAAAAAAARIRSAYRPGGARAFEIDFFRRVYQRPFEVVVTDSGDLPEPRADSIHAGGHLDGCRIGIDLGASDYKVAAVIDGVAVFRDELPWEPRHQSDPHYHLEHIGSALDLAAAHLPRVDAIGVSAAGIYVDDRVRVASLFRGVPDAAFTEVIEPMFVRLREQWRVPLRVVNDGDVTALAGAMALDAGAILGIAMGSGEAGGFIDRDRCLTGWLNEFGFCPVDMNPDAAVDEWSQDYGVGTSYFSQQGVGRLAKQGGLATEGTLPEILLQVQGLMARGDPRAMALFETIGAQLGYTLAWYREFYDFDTVLLLGRVTSGRGGEVLKESAEGLLQAKFPHLAAAMVVRLPDEATRRVGQAVAAASLPEI